jgi:heme/copper-type cytochrome/quinol oxidase subunit 2
MKPMEGLEVGELRYYEVDTPLVLPYGREIRFLVGSTDVIHSFAIPTSGIKADGNPGSLNRLTTVFRFPGKFYGRCSELCGVDHSFIPIGVEVTSPMGFKSYLRC